MDVDVGVLKAGAGPSARRHAQAHDVLSCAGGFRAEAAGYVAAVDSLEDVTSPGDSAVVDAVYFPSVSPAAQLLLVSGSLLL